MQHEISSGPSSTVQIAQSRTGILKRIWNKRMLYLMFLPCVILLGVFCYYPMYGIVIAFKDFYVLDGIWGSPWVGLDNFKDLFSSQIFGKVMRNTILISLYRLFYGLPVPILLALIINEMRNGLYKKFAQTVSYLPHFISWVVVASLFTQLLSPGSGIVNAIIKAIGFEPIYFMATPNLFRSVLVTSGIWKEMGWSSIIYIAMLSQVDTEIYDAAMVDGASRIKRIMHINFPYILPLVSITFILSMGGILNAGFDQIFNMANTSVLDVCDIIDTYVYRVGLVETNYSLSTVVGLFKNVIGLIFVIISQIFIYLLNKRMGDREVYGLY